MKTDLTYSYHKYLGVSRYFEGICYILQWEALDVSRYHYQSNVISQTTLASSDLGPWLSGSHTPSRLDPFVSVVFPLSSQRYCNPHSFSFIYLYQGSTIRCRNNENLADSS